MSDIDGFVHNFEFSSTVDNIGHFDNDIPALTCNLSLTPTHMHMHMHTLYSRHLFGQ